MYNQIILWESFYILIPKPGYQVIKSYYGENWLVLSFYIRKCVKLLNLNENFKLQKIKNIIIKLII